MGPSTMPFSDGYVHAGSEMDHGSASRVLVSFGATDYRYSCLGHTCMFVFSAYSSFRTSFFFHIKTATGSKVNLYDYYCKYGFR